MRSSMMLTVGSGRQSRLLKSLPTTQKVLDDPIAEQSFHDFSCSAGKEIMIVAGSGLDAYELHGGGYKDGVWDAFDVVFKELGFYFEVLFPVHL